MAFKFNVGTFKLGGTLDMASATDVIHKNDTVDNDDLAGGITASKINFGQGLKNQGGQLQVQESGSNVSGIGIDAGGIRVRQGNGIAVDGAGNLIAEVSGSASGLDVNAGGLFVKLNGSTLQKANSGLSVNVANVTNGLAQANVNINSGDGLTGGGNLTNSRTLSIDLAASNPGLDFDGSGGGGQLKLKSTIGGARTFSGNVTFNGDIDCDANNISMFASVGANTITVGHDNSTVIINGDLQIDGSLDTRSATEIKIDDLTLQLADGAADSAAANNAGMKIDGAGVIFKWDHAQTRMDLNKTLAATGFVGDGSALTNLPAAGNTNLANETSDDETFLIFAGNATGGQALKTNTSLKFNAATGGLSAKHEISTVLKKTVGANLSLSNAECQNGIILLDMDNSARTVTLPAINTPAAGFVAGRKTIVKRNDNNGNVALTLKCNASDQHLEGANSIVLEAGAAVTLVHNDNNSMMLIT